MARTFDIVSSTPVGSTRSSGSSTAMASSSGDSTGSTQPIGVPEAQRLGLHHRLHLDQRRGAAHLLQHHLLAAGLQRAFQHQVLDEVRDDAVLALGRDDHQPLGAGLRGLGGHQLDAGRVDDGQQLLGHRLGGGQETRAQAGGRHDRRARNRVPGGVVIVHTLTAIVLRVARLAPVPSLIPCATSTKAELRAAMLAARARSPPQVHAAEADALTRPSARSRSARRRPSAPTCRSDPSPGRSPCWTRCYASGARVLLPVAVTDADGAPLPLRWGRVPARASSSRPGCGLLRARRSRRLPAAGAGRGRPW